MKLGWMVFARLTKSVVDEFLGGCKERTGQRPLGCVPVNAGTPCITHQSRALSKKPKRLTCTGKGQ